MKAYYLRGNYQNSFKNKVGEKERVEEKCNKQKSLPLGRLMRLRERLKLCAPKRKDGSESHFGQHTLQASLYFSDNIHVLFW